MQSIYLDDDQRAPVSLIVLTSSAVSGRGGEAAGRHHGVSGALSLRTTAAFGERKKPSELTADDIEELLDGRPSKSLTFAQADSC